MTELKDRKLLIIDDEPDLRLMLADYFEDEGAKTATAANGGTGLARLREWCPDVVLVDLNMPGLDGFGFIEQAVAEAPETPIIVISGAAMAGDAIRAIRLGAWEYIQKPIHDLPFLNSVLDRVLKKAAILRKNRLSRENLERLVEAQAGKSVAAGDQDQVGNEARSAFLDLSRELRTTLSTLLAPLEQMARQAPPAQASLIMEEVTASRRLLDMVQQVLDCTETAEGRGGGEKQDGN